jgi:hypothetical protein
LRLLGAGRRPALAVALLTAAIAAATLSHWGETANAQTVDCWPEALSDQTGAKTFLSSPCQANTAPRGFNAYVDDTFSALSDPFVAKSAGATNDLYAVNKFEVRGGVFAHGVGSVEANTYDLNLEFATPRILPYGAGQWWALFIPRFEIGGFLNTDGRTSEAYGGALWTFPIYKGLFSEIFAGGAINNGLQDGSATRSALGCTGAFNLGTSLGYQFTSSWSLMGTWNHMSNGNSALGVNCPHNKGVNDFGLKAGYAF